MSEKKTVRREISAAIRELNPEQRIVLDAQIGTHITHLPFWSDASVVAGYAAIGDEVDLQAVLRAARQQGKRVALPRVSDNGEPRMTFRFVADDLIDLERHPYGFLQPRVESEELTDLTRTLLLVPGRAFDRIGRRVGRGGGYYDEFLAHHPASFAVVGVAYSVQLRREVPADSSDQRVQIVITESETCFCKRPERT